MAKSKSSVSPNVVNRLLTLVAIVVIAVFAVLVGQQVVRLKNKHSASTSKPGDSSLAPPAQFHQQ